MANNLAVLIPFLVASMQDVLRQTGFLWNGVTIDATAEAAGKGQSINLPGTAALSSGDVTPGPVPPAFVDTTPTAGTLALNQYKGARFNLTAEEWRALAVQGPNFRSTQVNEAIASVINTATAYVVTKADQGAGIAFGAQGTVPFNADPDIVADLWQSFQDSYAPPTDRVLALSSLDMAAAFKLDQFQRLQDAPQGVNFGTGEIARLMGFMTGNDQSLLPSNSHTAGGGSGYLVNNGAGYPIGATSIVVDTGTGTLLKGDVVTFAGDTNKYVIAADYAGGAGTITLNEGLKVATVDNAAITKQATHRVNLAMHRSAIAVGVRPPAEAPEGDASTIRQIIRDPVTGIAGRLAYYPGYHGGQWEFSLLYDAVVRRPTLLRKLIG